MEIDERISAANITRYNELREKSLDELKHGGDVERAKVYALLASNELTILIHRGKL